jgi:hypothetical protein
MVASIDGDHCQEMEFDEFSITAAAAGKHVSSYGSGRRKTVVMYQMLKPCNVCMKVAYKVLHQAFILNSSQGLSQNIAMHTI